MKALLLAATSSLALTGFAMAQTAVETGTPGAAATPPAAGSTAADSSSDASTGGAGAGTVENASPAAGGADGAGSTATGAGMEGHDMSSMATGTTSGTATGGDMTTGGESGSAAGMGAAGTAGTSGGMAGSAGAGSTETVTTTESATVTTTTADMGAAAMPAGHPGMLGSWIMNRRIWTTNQPSSTEWSNTTLSERPADWTDIAKIDDIMIDAQGNITGYVADIGGFLGLGAKQVLLNKDALHFVQIGEDAFFATNFTREELEALPDFDNTTVMR